eukprot:CAMPEP_0175076010 /NCGR_PEP_ID=MMETSP0052_2-20121109/22428_1 /TAXON_ID=51329 ORGANISM="Polytomella parva, Strain SAG 63-3" /NCGR_SAMPLE_ID=MMETSP0052_2 /ASSEMBLY_ACC=CAM_ASM_000194 /LENGTH=84 /DNA_ID=CAMNT_0016344979 /DNA_START=1429 /DNA_END=1681 /DNA_ORIENTATION=+
MNLFGGIVHNFRGQIAVQPTVEPAPLVVTEFGSKNLNGGGAGQASHSGDSLDGCKGSWGIGKKALGGEDEGADVEEGEEEEEEE